MFGGFRATLNLLGGKRNKNYELTPDLFVTGAYRTSKSDFYAFNNNDENRKQDVVPQLRPAKSTPNLSAPKPVIPNLRNTVNEVSLDPRGAETERNRQNIPIAPNKATKKLEKQRVIQEKAREKQEALERAKQEKLKKEKKDAQSSKQKRDRNTKMPAPQPPIANIARIPVTPNTAAQRPYSTNTLESSISRSSGPPPYSEVPENLNRDKTGNVLFSKPKADEGSWDMISRHRQQIARPNINNKQTNPSSSKRMVMDLNYNYPDSEAENDNDNSEA